MKGAGVTQRLLLLDIYLVTFSTRTVTDIYPHTYLFFAFLRDLRSSLLVLFITFLPNFPLPQLDNNGLLCYHDIR